MDITKSLPDIPYLRFHVKLNVFINHQEEQIDLLTW